ncbi:MULTISPECIES: hypothetical protein [unclassified Clostridium]|uniref:hypothetical protein n=1 Tax=unclassified Clostridium TaxID=2614128 RepID=UPI000297B65A|nr:MULTISPECIES: hypothetical protein [unclassified Clostridium]EKQ55106.1 MAG: hypothetical protein A370_02880 [Clostridium sp. Maddingley MBC34-26]
MENAILNFLRNKDNYYLANYNDIDIKDISEFPLENLALYRIEDAMFDEELSRSKVVENILNSIRIDGINFVYLMIGDNAGINFYFGISRDMYYESEMSIGLDDINSYILKPNIKGSPMKSKVEELDGEEKNRIYEIIDNMTFFSTLAGAAGVNEDNEKEKYIDTLINIFNGDEFGAMVIAKPLNIEQVWDIENNLNKLYTEISPLAQNSSADLISKTYGSSLAKSTGEAFTNVHNTSISILNSISETTGGNSGTGTTVTNGNSETSQSSRSSPPRSNNRLDMSQNNINSSPKIRGGPGVAQGSRNNSSNNSITISESRQESTDFGENWSKTTGTSDIKLGGYSRSNTTDSSITEVNSSSEMKTSSTTVDSVNKEVSSWIKYMDDVLFKRLDYGKGKGLFTISTLLFSNKEVINKKLENFMGAILAGDSGNKVPIKAITLTKDSVLRNAYGKFQLPYCSFSKDGYIDNPLARCAISQYLDDKGNIMFGNWISTKELSLIIGIPKSK